MSVCSNELCTEGVIGALRRAAVRARWAYLACLHATADVVVVPVPAVRLVASEARTEVVVTLTTQNRHRVGRARRARRRATAGRDRVADTRCTARYV